MAEHNGKRTVQPCCNGRSPRCAAPHSCACRHLSIKALRTAAGFHFNFPLGPGSNYDIWEQQPERLPPLLFRPLSNREPTADLQRPRFDSTTVPLVLVAEWAENYGERAGYRQSCFTR